MIIRSLKQLEGSERDVFWGNGQSRRFLLQKDGMGYSLTDTVVEKGTTSLLEYKNHFEACYCIEGTGSVRTYADGKVYEISPGTMYALDKHEKHYLYAETTMRLVCVFNPPLRGDESHSLDSNNSSSY